MGVERIKIDLDLSNDLIPLIEDLGLSKSLNDNITISIAIALFTSKSVSLTRAAEIAGMDLVDFMDLLKNKNIPWNEYTEDELRLDRNALRDFKDELGNRRND